VYKLQFLHLYLQFYYVSVADAPGLPFTPGLPLLIIGLDRVDGNKEGVPIFGMLP